MTEETTITSRETSGPSKSDSSFAGISVRAWLAVVLTTTVCATHGIITLAVAIDAVLQKDFSKLGTFATIGEPLYSMAVGALGFYFGQKNSKPS